MSYQRRSVMDHDEAVVWLGGAVPTLAPPPTPWTYIEELEQEVRFARHEYIQTLATTLARVLERQRA